MAQKPAPIVITLKKRLGTSRRVEEDDDVSEAAEKGTSAPRAPASTGAASRSRSPAEREKSKSERPRSRKSPVKSPRKSRSPLRSLSPIRPAHTSTAPSSVLNTSALEEIFNRFHKDIDSWLQGESAKLERSESRGKEARDCLKKNSNAVTEFLKDYAPRMYEDLGDDKEGESFTMRGLPNFLDLVDEDRRALQEFAGILSAFADRCFPKSKDLESLKDGSPLPLLKAILKLLSAAPPPRSGHRSSGGGRDGGQRGGRDRDDRSRSRSPR